MAKMISVIRNGKFVDFTVPSNKVVSATNEVVLVSCEKSIYAVVDGKKTAIHKNMNSGNKERVAQKVARYIGNSVVAEEVMNIIGYSPVVFGKTNTQEGEILEGVEDLAVLDMADGPRRKVILRLMGGKQQVASLVESDKVAEVLATYFKNRVTVAVKEAAHGVIRLDLVVGGKTRKVLIPKGIVGPELAQLADSMTIEGEAVTLPQWLGATIYGCSVDSGKFRKTMARCNRVESLMIDVSSYSSVSHNGLGGVNGIKEGVGLLKTYYRTTEDSIFAVNVDDKLLSQVKGETKLIARLGTLIQGAEVLTIPGLRVGIITDNTEGLINPHFWRSLCAGAAIANPKIIKTYGSFRMVSRKLGLKAEVMPMTKELNEILGDFDLLVGPNSVKAGVRGVYAAITGCSEKEALLADNALVRLTVESQIEVVETSYGPLNIVGCYEDAVLTNWHTIEGWSLVGSEESFFNKTIEAFSEGKIVSVPKFIAQMAKKGAIVRGKEEVGLTYGLLQNAMISYGHGLIEELVNEANTSSLDLMFSKGTYIEYDKQESNRIMGYFNSSMKGFLSSSVITEESMADGWNIGLFKERFLNGCRIGGLAFAGFATANMVLNLGGFRFFFPRSAFSGDAVFMDSGDSTRLGDMAQQFMLLLVAMRNKENVWSRTFVSFNATMNRKLFGKRGNSYAVKGRYMNLLPLYWEESGINQVVSTWASANKKPHQHVAYAKQPVLFDQAFTGVKLLDVDTVEVFGFDTDWLRVAMSAMIFASPDLIIGQQNDCDGDQAALCITNSAVPQYQGQRHATAWFDEYVRDELSANVLTSGIEVVELDSSMFGASFVEAIEAKERVGMDTAVLFRIQHILDMILSTGKIITAEEGRIIKEVYASLVQDGSVRAIKHGQSSSEIGLDDISWRRFVDGAEGHIATMICAKAEQNGDNLSLAAATKFVVSGNRIIKGSNKEDWGSTALVKTTMRGEDFSGLYATKGINTGNSMTHFALFTSAYWGSMEAKSQESAMLGACKDMKSLGNVIERFSRIGTGQHFILQYNAERFKTINMIVSEVAIRNAPEEVCVAHEDIVLVSELGKEVAVAPQVVEAYDYGYEL